MSEGEKRKKEDEEVQEEDDILVEMDKSRISQVLTNIIGNALKFTQNGFVRVEGRALPKKNRYEIRVSDSGGGIPESLLPSLFKLFATKSVGSEVVHGTGLGLFISRAIITAHKGAIYVCNDGVVGGTIVMIQIPISRTTAIV
jgi:signal transduction histidine kinase